MGMPTKKNQGKLLEAGYRTKIKTEDTILIIISIIYLF